jgi:hypothetical protein
MVFDVLSNLEAGRGIETQLFDNAAIGRLDNFGPIRTNEVIALSVEAELGSIGTHGDEISARGKDDVDTGAFRTLQRSPIGLRDAQVGLKERVVHIYRYESNFHATRYTTPAPGMRRGARAAQVGL